MGDAALVRACKEMRAAEKRDALDDAEIVGSPAAYWLGDRRIAARTVDLGLLALVFRSEGIGTDYERHALNERGRECARTGRIPAFVANESRKSIAPAPEAHAGDLSVTDTQRQSSVEMPSIGLGTMRTSATYAALFIALEGDRDDQINVLLSVLDALGIFPEELAHLRERPDVVNEHEYARWKAEAERIRARCLAATSANFDASEA